MSYTKTQWRNNQSPAINADNLNHIEQGVYDAYQDITAETLARESTDNNLQAQIDQLVAPSGTAPNPAEIENARIGADGVTYDTLGNAIRTQLTDLKSEIVKGDVSIEQLRALLPTETVSGDMVSITDGQSVVPADSLEVSLSPIQDLNGYDNPWVGGAGKNKLYIAPQTLVDRGITWTVNADGTVTATGTLTATKSAVYINATVPTGSYKFNSSGTGSASSTYYAQVVDGSNWYNPDYGKGDVDVTISSTNVRVYFATITNPPSGGITFKPMLRLASETDATFEPYSNICPISGRTEVVTHRTGQNLIRVARTFTSRNGITYTENADGTVHATGTATAESLSGGIVTENADSRCLYALPSGTYTATNYSSDINMRVFYQVWNASKTVTLSSGTIGGSGTKRTITLTKPSIVYARVDIASGITVDGDCLFMFTKEESTAYEPYNGRTYTTELGRTVYGGTLDVTSGVLTVDRASITFVGTETWSSSNNGMRLGRQLPSGAKPNSGNNTLVGAICSAFSERTLNQTWAGGASGIGFSIDTASTPYIYFCRTGNKDMTQANWNEYLASNPITVVYPLATPQTYQLTPQQIDLLLGTNHLWSDGEITLVYGADIQLWVEKKLQ